MKKLLLLILILGAVGTVCAHGISEADKQAIAEGGNLRYLWLGAIHMVTGYDHLLFLFGVIFYLTGLKDILKFITAFTLGHSITLIAATFIKVTANYYLVDAVIALSVCYKAFDNMDGFRKYLGFNPPHLLTMIFAFGLIHGFGLSTRLQQLPLPEQGLLTRILSFNVGVELGQVAALSVLVALLAGWRRTESFRKLGGIANFLLLLAGVGLFAFQITHYLRGTDAHHGEDSHGSEDKGHSHEEGTHDHGGEGHSDGAGKHSHGDSGGESESDSARSEAGHVHYHGVKAQERPYAGPLDSAGEASDSSEPADSREGGHSHGHGHSHDHDQDQGLKPKKPAPKKPNAHSHEGEATHVH